MNLNSNHRTLCGEPQLYSPHVCGEPIPYLHTRPDWPQFRWDPDLQLQLAQTRLHQGQLLGQLTALRITGLTNPTELTLTTHTQTIISTSAIEGEPLSIPQVRSSLARHLNLPIGHPVAVGRNVEGLVQVQLDATRNYGIPMTANRIKNWHATLFPTGWSTLGRIRTGDWRDGPIQVVSGTFERPYVHFEAPLADRLPAEMDRFLDWFEQTTPKDPLLKAGLCQLYFLTLHPFEDGNGRIGRALTDLLLARSEGGGGYGYSLSRQIHAERNDYYRALEEAQRGDMDVTVWLSWFLGCLERAILQGQAELKRVLEKGSFWMRYSQIPLSERQRKVVNRLWDGFEGKLTSSKYAKMQNVSQDTALRDLEALVVWGLLVRVGGGRSTEYRLSQIPPGLS